MKVQNTSCTGRNELVAVLESARGRKALVLDMSLGGILVHVVPEVSSVSSQRMALLNRWLAGLLPGRITTPHNAPASSPSW
jgi:hypothetical protein